MTQKISILLWIVLSIIFATSVCGQTKEQQRILDKFVTMHNIGTVQVIEGFIKDTYHPDIYKKIEVSKHVAFYQQVISDFGPLNNQVYAKIEEEPLSLTVHLIREQDEVFNKHINLAHVLVLKMNLHPDNAAYMDRGLGLGALICTIKR